MYSSIDVRPYQSNEIFSPDHRGDADTVKFTINPIVFHMPERPNRINCNLYVTVKGTLGFEPSGIRKSLKTKYFCTEIGYFRNDENKLNHIYGAHYDLDENKFGHPVFHSHIAPQMELLNPINERYHTKFEADDKVTPMLTTVRTPTAQMDFFSVIAKLCADHLVNETSAPEVKKAFSQMRSASSFFIGAAHRMPYLYSDMATKCYRSTHWYDGTP